MYFLSSKKIEMYGNEQGVPATFNVVNFIGWKPDPKQVYFIHIKSNIYNNNNINLLIHTFSTRFGFFSKFVGKQTLKFQI